MKKKYQSFNEIQADLKKLYLEKEIAYEELKIVKRDFEDYLKPINWFTELLKKLCTSTCFSIYSVIITTI